MGRGRILGADDDLGLPWDIWSLDGNRLLIVDMFSPPFVKILDRQAGRVVHTFGVEGEGPSEIQNPTSVFRSAAHPGVVEVYDGVSHRITLVTEGGKGGGPSYQTERPFHIKADIIVLQTHLDGYVGVGHFAYHTLSVIDAEGRTVERLATDPPFDPADMGGSVGGARLLNRPIMDGMGGRFAVAYAMAPFVDLIDLDARAYTRVVAPRPATTHFEIRERRLHVDESSIGAYTDVAVTNRLIVALFNGATHAEQMAEPGSRFIEVFDWEGRYLAEFEMPHGIQTVAISPDDRFLWTDFEDPYPRVSEWALPPIAELAARMNRGEEVPPSALCPDGRLGSPTG